MNRATAWRRHKQRDLEPLEKRFCLTAFGFAQHELSSDDLTEIETVEARDIDVDGDLDIVIRGFRHDVTDRRARRDNFIAWYDNTNGQGDFEGPNTILEAGVDDSILQHRLVDLDGDDREDLLVATQENGVVWYRGPVAGGQFGSMRQLQPAAHLVDAMDIDEDGDVDVLVETLGELAWNQNDGSGQFSARQSIGAPALEVGDFASIRIGDIDGDGRRDILAISHGSVFSTAEISLYRNLGHGNYATSALDISALTSDGDTITEVALASMDADEDLDIVVLTFPSSCDFGACPSTPIRWLENNGQGEFTTTHTINDELILANEFAVADLDSDGDADVLTASTWFENVNGGTQFIRNTIPDHVSTTGADGLLLGADLDGDNDHDLIVAGSAVTWFENRPIGDADDDGRFGSSDLVTVFQAGKYEDGIPNNATFAEGDWDGDGDFGSSDLVAAFKAGTYSAAALPAILGDFEIGQHIEHLTDPERPDRALKTLVWYPVDKGDVTDESPLTYFQHDSDDFWWYPSPFFGGFRDAPVSKAGQFPVVILSHGNGGWPVHFGIMGEVLASHGYIVIAPRHRDAWGFDQNRLGVNSHRPADMQWLIRLVKDRALGDRLVDHFDTEQIAIGGYSLGSLASMAAIGGRPARSNHDFDVMPGTDLPQAMILIDGSRWQALDTGPGANGQMSLELTEDINVPTLSINGADQSFTTNSVDLPSAELLVGLEIKNTNHWSFATNLCQFYDALVESGAPESVFDVIGRNPNAWPGCDGSLTPLKDVQERAALHTVAFLDELFKEERAMRSILPDSAAESVRTSLRIQIDPPKRDVMQSVMTIGDRRQAGNSADGRFNDIGEAVRVGSSTSRHRYTFSAPLAGEHVVVDVSTNDMAEHGSEVRAEVSVSEALDDGIHSLFYRRIVATSTVGPSAHVGPFALSVSPGLCHAAWDFNEDGSLGTEDVDMLSSLVRQEAYDTRFDVTVDDVLDMTDRDVWIRQFAGIPYGDANFDGYFNADDLVSVFQGGGYEDDVVGNGTWANGDFNGDGEFTTSDLVFIFQRSDFEAPRQFGCF